MYSPEIFIPRQAAVFSLARDIIEECSSSEEQKSLLLFFLNGLDARNSEEYFPCINLPYAVYKGIKGSEGDVKYLSVACLFLFLSADIIDDIADGDFLKLWGEKVSPSAGILASLMFASSIAPLALDNLRVDDKLISGLKSSLSRSIIRASAGQQGDLDANNKLQSTTPDDHIMISQGKAGFGMAGICSASAQLAGLDKKAQSEFGSIGCLIGTAGEVMKECYELYNINEGRDLESQKPTLPLAIHFANLGTSEQIEFLRLLDQARIDESARVEVRRLVAESGALYQTYDFVKESKNKALTSLSSLPSHDDSSMEEFRSTIIKKFSFNS